MPHDESLAGCHGARPDVANGGFADTAGPRRPDVMKESFTSPDVMNESFMTPDADRPRSEPTGAGRGECAGLPDQAAAGQTAATSPGP
ncbi:hypothetical protein [Amycolatopsis eburnea]|uniref:Uncharacterized protein n=1 Tax=Amycolatopsis eburnea TaxID=2267691 RepID=A0A3R9F6K6_9PSEU|nr:hypothetical protein [Amycolatopsis eburnea]RSD13652.1 hypothetical protein EIY87_28580 [Amycolatopsis eburnea]